WQVCAGVMAASRYDELKLRLSSTEMIIINQMRGIHGNLHHVKHVN
ncbi:MAG: hypothetical protein ACI9TP_002518, partial [Candidatus Azotimanducaceae bacterium]